MGEGKIIKLISENFKRLKAVEITPEGNLVVISGRNGQGKTSVLDSIMAALAGGSKSPQMPIRKGESKAQITLELTDLIVQRNFTEKGSYLKVTNKEGFKPDKPQDLLDKLIGMLSFDPLEFIKLEKKQVEILKNITGLDFTGLDKQKAEVFTKRTDINREVKSLKGKLDGMQSFDNLPDQEISVVELTQKLQEMNDNVRQLDKMRSGLANMKNDYFESGQQIKETMAEITRLEQKKSALASQLETLDKDIKKGEAAINGFKVPDTASITKQISEADTTNQKIRANRDRMDLSLELEEKVGIEDELTGQIKNIEDSKLKQLEAAKMPVQGLSFDDTGVSYNGIPFSQISQAEQLRVSLAIGLALNPKLRVILIRDGSLLDKDNLAIIKEMAEKNDAQIWLERVSDDGEGTGIIIEDGQVKGVV